MPVPPERGEGKKRHLISGLPSKSSPFMDPAVNSAWSRNARPAETVPSLGNVVPSAL